MDDSTGKLLHAVHFSASKHRDQRRKDQPRSPYINHPIRVAEILWTVGAVRDEATLLAAILHDVIEDTQTTPAEIQTEFGEIVLRLVLEVTDDKDLPKQQRKRRQIEHAPHLSRPAQLIRLADKISNLHDLLYSPPQRWSLQRRQDYVRWTEKVVAGLRGASPAMEQNYDHLLKEGKQILQIE